MEAPVAREDNAPRLMLTAAVPVNCSWEILPAIFPNCNLLFVIHTVVPAFNGRSFIPVSAFGDRTQSAGSLFCRWMTNRVVGRRQKSDADSRIAFLFKFGIGL